VRNLLRTGLVLTLFLLTQPIFAGYQSGLDAYNDGDYKAARYEWIAVITTPPGKVSPAILAETNYTTGMLDDLHELSPRTRFITRKPA
jgi:hypothetical protein